MLCRKIANKAFKMNNVAGLGRRGWTLSKRVSKLGARSNFASSSEEAVQVKEAKPDEEIKNLEPRIERRKPKIEPVIKNLFLGKFPGEMLAFPEILNKVEIENLNLLLESIKKCVSDKEMSSDNFMGYLKRAGVYGAPAPAFNGGLASILSERCRLLESFESKFKIARKVRDQWHGVDFLLKGLNDEKIREFVPDVTSGNSDIRVILEEALSTNPNATEIRSSCISDINNEFLLNGEKLLREQNLNNSYFITCCKNHREIPDIFMIQPNSKGLTVNYPFVNFKKTPGTLLGREFGNYEAIQTGKIVDYCTSNYRLGTAAISLGLLKSSIKEFVQFTRNKYILGKSLSEMPLFQDAISEAVLSTYAIESMVYYTAGLADGYENPDILLETILCKAYATNATYRHISVLANTIGLHELPSSLTNDLEYAKELLMGEERNDKMKLFAALTGFQFAGESLAEEIKMARNPFKFPHFVFKKVFSDSSQEDDEPECNLRLADHLHPSLQDSAKLLEYCIMRLKYATEILLTRHGANVVEEHRSLKRVANVASEIYACLTCLSRASRSYCIGLHMAENEINVAAAISILVQNKVKHTVLDIHNDYLRSLDNVRNDVGEKSFERGCAYHEHALERVFF